MAELTEADIQRIAAAVARSVVARPPAAIPDETMSAIAAAAARTAVQEHSVKTFALLGYNVANETDIKRLRANLEFADRLREGSADVGRAITKAVATAIVIAILAWLAIGAKFSIGGQAPPPLK